MRKLAFSLVDQLLVSGGNFLTIAICAHMLPLSEQGKYTYIFASYIALLLLNVAGIFQGAAVRAPTQESTYKISLAKLQLVQSILLSLLVCTAWFIFGESVSWAATTAELTLLFAFLMIQQLADFDRRSAYIFSGTRRAFNSSVMLYPLRIIGLLVIQPKTVSQVLVVLIISAIIPAIPTLLAASKGGLIVTRYWMRDIKEHLLYSKLFIAGAPLGWLWSYIPILLLGVMHGKEQAALLASIRGISNMANVLMEQIETKVVADWARTHHLEGEQHMEEEATEMLKIGVVLWLIGLIITVVLGREIVTLALGELYAAHWHLLLIGWIGYGAYFITRILGIKRRALGFNQVEFIGGLCGVATALISGFLMIPGWSELGAAWVYVVIAAAMLGSQIYFTKWIAR